MDIWFDAGAACIFPSVRPSDVLVRNWADVFLGARAFGCRNPMRSAALTSVGKWCFAKNNTALLDLALYSIFACVIDLCRDDTCCRTGE